MLLKSQSDELLLVLLNSKIDLAESLCFFELKLNYIIVKYNRFITSILKLSDLLQQDYFYGLIGVADSIS